MTGNLCILVTGVRLTLEPLRGVISRRASQCSDENTDCYLIDDGAIIVYSDSPDDKVRSGHKIASIVIIIIIT